VAQEALHIPDIYARFDQLSRGGVPKHVGSYSALQARLLPGFHNARSHGGRGHRGTNPVEKQVSVIDAEMSASCEMSAHGLLQPSTGDEDDSLSRTFARHANAAVGKVEIQAPNADDFAHSQAGRYRECRRYERYCLVGSCEHCLIYYSVWYGRGVAEVVQKAVDFDCWDCARKLS
jgi:hypothetical protein